MLVFVERSRGVMRALNEYKKYTRQLPPSFQETEMKGFIRQTAVGCCFGAVLFTLAGCYTYRNLVDPCWPERYSSMARHSVRDISNAHAWAQQVTARAQGDAAAFDKVYAQYKLAPDVTRRRMYYETMEQVLSKVDKTIVEAPGITPYLPLPQVQKQQQERQQ